MSDASSAVENTEAEEVYGLEYVDVTDEVEELKVRLWRIQQRLVMYVDDPGTLDKLLEEQGQLQLQLQDMRTLLV